MRTPGDEEFVIQPFAPTRATIVDDLGVGTIIDNERDGTFSCRASASRVTGVQPAVANAQGSPCVDAARTVSAPAQTAGLLRVSTGSSTASTDQTPDMLEPTAPAATDRAVAVAGAQGIVLGALGVLNLRVANVRSEARVQCALVAGVLTPRFTGSSSITGLTLNGLPLSITGGTIPLAGGFIEVNRTVTTATSVTQQASGSTCSGQTS